MKHDKNHRSIECETCDHTPTLLQAWASDWLLDREGADDIEELTDEDVRRLSRTENSECSIEGYCHPCNGV